MLKLVFYLIDLVLTCLLIPLIFKTNFSNIEVSIVAFIKDFDSEVHDKEIYLKKYIFYISK